MKLHKHYRGCYRTETVNGKFGQIKKVNLKWVAEIRSSDTGNLLRFAGVWSSRKDAVEEVEHILNQL